VIPSVPALAWAMLHGRGDPQMPIAAVIPTPPNPYGVGCGQHPGQSDASRQAVAATADEAEELERVAVLIGEGLNPRQACEQIFGGAA
jgi:hypothetical protein